MTLHEGLGPNLTATVLICGSLAFITMGLRLYTRTTRRNWGLEDSVMLGACVPLLALTISTAAGSYNGLGVKDDAFKRPGNAKYMEAAYFWFFLFQVFFCFAVIGVKISISCMLNRIAGNRRGFIYANYGLMTLATVANLGSAFYIIFQCSPVEAAWKADLIAAGKGKCQPSIYLANVYYMDTAVNIFTDWASALMPVALLWNVKMNRNTKISVSAILGLGIFTSVSGLIRLKYTINLTSSVNYLHGLANVIIWGYAEPSLGMIVANISTLRPLFLRVFRLDSEHSSNVISNATPRVLGGKRSHPYQSFAGDHELETVTGRVTHNHIRGGEEASSLNSDSASEKEILSKSQQGQIMDPKGILVSRHVEITRD